jgi:hypothetical protein
MCAIQLLHNKYLCRVVYHATKILIHPLFRNHSYRMTLLQKTTHRWFSYRSLTELKLTEMVCVLTA